MFIYLATNRVNGKPYVGKTEKTLETRWKWHLNSARKGGPNLIHRALRKYGDDAFSLQIIERDVPTKERLAELEAIWIILMNSKIPNGYNMSDGGDGLYGKGIVEEYAQTGILPSVDAIMKIQTGLLGI
jgi:group I intron endonuclease